MIKCLPVPLFQRRISLVATEMPSDVQKLIGQDSSQPCRELARCRATKLAHRGVSFQQLSAGLPPAPAYDLIYRHGLDVDASGDGLAMGSTTGALWSSRNGGDTWSVLSVHLPPIYCVRFGA